MMYVGMPGSWPIRRGSCCVLPCVPASRTLLLVAALLGASAAPAAAAPTLGALQPCYAFAGYDEETDRYDAEPIELVASGLRPGASTRVIVDGTTIASGVRADAAGELRYVAMPPIQKAGARAFDVAVIDESDPRQAAVGRSRVTALGARIRPRRGAPRRRVRFRGRGFTDASRPVYAHYVRRGRVRRTVRLKARPSGPCGTFSSRRRRFPLRRPRPGRWTVRIDQFASYRPAPPGVHVDLTIRVRPALGLESQRG